MMKKHKQQNNKDVEEDIKMNKQWQGDDKDPQEEKKKGEKVTMNDLKNKEVDADPVQEEKPETGV